MHFGIQKAAASNDPPSVLTWQIGVTDIDAAMERCRSAGIGFELEHNNPGPGWVYRNGVKLSGDWHQPEGDLGQRRQPGGLAWLAGLVPAPRALGLAFVAAPGAERDEVPVPGDLGGQVGGELVKEARGKSTRSR